MTEREECPYVDRMFTNLGLGRLLFCRLKEEQARDMNPVKRFFLKLAGRFQCNCPAAKRKDAYV